MEREPPLNEEAAGSQDYGGLTCGYRTCRRDAAEQRLH